MILKLERGEIKSDWFEYLQLFEWKEILCKKDSNDVTVVAGHCKNLSVQEKA